MTLINVKMVSRTKSFFRNFLCSLTVVTISCRKYYGSCFIYLSDILSRLQMCKVTNFVTFSVVLLINIYNFAYKLHS